MLGFRLFWLTGDRLAQLLQRHTNLGIRHADLLNKYTATLVDIAETLHCWDRDCQQTSMSESGHSRQERTSANARVYEYTPFCNGPVDVNCSPIVTPPSSRFCPWLALRPPHYAEIGRASC